MYVSVYITYNTQCMHLCHDDQYLAGPIRTAEAALSFCVASAQFGELWHPPRFCARDDGLDIGYDGIGYLHGMYVCTCVSVCVIVCM